MNRLLCLVLLLSLSLPAFGWSLEGHRLVGELAERRLSPAAKAEVARLLAGEADPTLAGVAGWADEIRADEGSVLGQLSRRWHYLNFPRDAGCRFDPARDCADGECVVGAIEAQRAILANPAAPLAQRRDALKFLVHFVGDVHQPMHAGFGHDRGGNEYQISFRGRGARGGSEGTNLHRVWDYWLLRSAGLDRVAYADALSARPPVDVAPLPHAPGAPAAWAIESCRLIADAGLYPRGHVLRDDYLDTHRPLAERRVRQAGERLAALVEGALVAAPAP